MLLRVRLIDWGLRDYGNEGQIGLEKTPQEYVASILTVFREVWRVLKPDGVLWLNLGDSYNAYNGGAGPSSSISRGASTTERPRLETGYGLRFKGLKPKDLVGIPWLVAKALQAPQYHGEITNEIDRVWLAAMLDAEGCMFIHKRKAGQSNGQGYYRQNDNYGPGVEICNTSLAVVERIMELVGRGSICTSDKGTYGRKQTLYRWNLRTTESRRFVQELYPYLIAKKQQARILCGCPPNGERAEAAHAALIGLHRGIETDVDFKAPESLFTPGWYLRSDVIWAKSNPMPESVTDRPTKAHEYIFLLAKSERYFYDHEAIAEPFADERMGASGAISGTPETYAAETGRGGDQGLSAFRGAYRAGRNKRSVWHVSTSPYPEAHYATFPEEIPETCIRAGSKPGDLILDPFFGSGTVGRAAERLSRRWVGLDLGYQDLQAKRVRNVQKELVLL